MSGFSSCLIYMHANSCVWNILCISSLTPQSESHRVLSLCVCQAAVTAAPSVCCCVALDASALPPAGYTAAADECTGEREQMTEGGGDKGKKVFRQQNPLTVTYLDPFAPQHVLQPGHVLVHLFQLLLQDRALVWQALIYIIHLIFPPTLSGSPCSLCSSLSAHQEALWESSSRGLGSLSRRESESGKRNREKGGKRQVVSSV